MAHQAVRDARRLFRAKIHSYTDVKERAKEATNCDLWMPTDSQKLPLAQASHNPADFKEISEVCWKRLEKQNEYWMQQYKSLDLLEYMLLMEAPLALDNIRRHERVLRQLTAYNSAPEPRDNVKVCAKAQRLLDLVHDASLLDEEREKHARVLSRISGLDQTFAVTFHRDVETEELSRTVAVHQRQTAGLGASGGARSFQQQQASGGGDQPTAQQQLAAAFPEVDKALLDMVLSECSGSADAAALALTDMGFRFGVTPSPEPVSQRETPQVRESPQYQSASSNQQPASAFRETAAAPPVTTPVQPPQFLVMPSASTSVADGGAVRPQPQAYSSPSQVDNSATRPTMNNNDFVQDLPSAAPVMKPVAQAPPANFWDTLHPQVAPSAAAPAATTMVVDPFAAPAVHQSNNNNNNFGNNSAPQPSISPAPMQGQNNNNFFGSLPSSSPSMDPFGQGPSSSAAQAVRPPPPPPSVMDFFTPQATPNVSNRATPYQQLPAPTMTFGQQQPQMNRPVGSSPGTLPYSSMSPAPLAQGGGGGAMGGNTLMMGSGNNNNNALLGSSSSQPLPSSSSQQAAAGGSRRPTTMEDFMSAQLDAMSTTRSAQR